MLTDVLRHRSAIRVLPRFTSTVLPDQWKQSCSIRTAYGDGLSRIDGRWLPLINYENRHCGILTAKALMKEGGVIACEAPRHPFAHMHPAVREGLPDAARRLEPLVLRSGT